MIMLRNEWVPVRPDVWKDKYDCTVSVGIGSGNRDQQLMHLSTMLSFAGDAMKGGLKIVNQKNLYNMGAALIKNMGFQNVEDFLTDPDQIPDQPDPKQSLPQMELQLKQKEIEIKAADINIKQQRIELETMKTQVDANLKMAEIQLEAEQGRPVAIG